MEFVGVLTGGNFALPVTGPSIIGSSITGNIRVIDYGLGVVTILGTQTGTMANVVSQNSISGWTSVIGGDVYGSLYDGLWSVDDDNSEMAFQTYLAQWGHASTAASALAVDVGANTFVYVANSNGSGLSAFDATSGAGFTLISSNQDTDAIYSDHISAMASVSIASETYIYVGSATEHGLTSYHVQADGSLSEVSAYGVDQLLPLQTITALSTATLNGQEYLIVAASGSSSITVMPISSDGTLRVSDQIIDDLGTRFQSITALEVVETNGWVFVLAAGADDGVTLMALLPSGQLQFIDSYIDTDDIGLANVSGLSAIVVGDELQIFATSSAEAGVTQLMFDLSTLGNVDLSTGANLVGSAGDDILQQDGAGNIDGGAGDDILVAGSGTNTLTGGAGNDVFVFSDDTATDTISDFERGQDQIDLSLWSTLYSVNLLEITAATWGATLRYEDFEIVVISDDGLPLNPNDLTSSIVFNLDHVPITLGVADNGSGTSIIGTPDADLLVGTSGGDHIEGLTGNDRIEGQDGNDTIYGAEGHDELLGHDGDDTIYGDTGNDNISGSHGGDYVNGGEGNDQIGGGDGNDTILGGPGYDTIGGGPQDDYIDGGTGGDVISGGYGIDQVYGGEGGDILAGSYGADILSGGAGNDSLGGGLGKDTMYGGDGDDSFGGGDGDDTIYGEAGNDFLAGGDGADILDGGDGIDSLNGGKGDDTLHGGAGADTFIFNDFINNEADTISDFTVGVDVIRLRGIDGADDAEKYAALAMFNVANTVEIAVGGHLIVLDGVDTMSLSVDDFWFI